MLQEYVKGFKIDDEKLRAQGFGPTEKDPSNTRYYRLVVGLLPRESYLYVATGFNDDGEDKRMELIIVMAYGFDKAELEKMDMPSHKEPVPNVAKAVLTAGVWLVND